jgi:hypothetical protein
MMAIRSVLRFALVAGLAVVPLTGCLHTEQASRAVVAPEAPRQSARVLPGDATSTGVGSGRERHQLLAIDPQSRPYRVLVPEDYLAGGEEYVSRVRICVSESGEVANVDVLRPSISAVDTQLPEIISRWHYRPYVTEGRVAAFCYPMDYRVR